LIPLPTRLNELSPERLAGMRRGIEKESLRARPDGRLALTPHPALLGSALTHPHITTDFSESQVELVTGVHARAEDCIAELDALHQLTYQAIGEERLWVSSMPCVLPDDDQIPIAQYGTSNVARAKNVYRTGLSHRYGRRMQTISGIHYNWSLPGLSNADYFALIRNFRRHVFLLLWLFGASPAVAESFVAGRRHELQPLGKHSLYLPHATSLRMGRLGYQSDAQSSLRVSYNCLDSYAASLQDALTRPYPAYEALGIQDAQGEYLQLGTTLLQIENEFYGTIRPKRTIHPGERPLHALRERGVEYIEVRCMDLDPFEPIGIHAQTARFLDVFLLYCALSDSPNDTPEEVASLTRNLHRTAAHGRKPGLLLERDGREVQLSDWAHELLSAMEPIAQHLDQVIGNGHQAAISLARHRLADASLTPSARVVTALAGGEREYVDFVNQRSDAVWRSFQGRNLTAEQQAHWESVARASLEEQRRLEAAPAPSFEEFRLEYVSADRLGA
jgi:glutamate--cysteine ligase